MRALLTFRKANVKVVKKVEKKPKKVSAKAFYIMTKAKSLTFSKRKDEYREGPTDKVGGVVCQDERVLDTLRQIAKEFMKKIVTRIFSLNFNLTTISFPIRCMRPLSLLESFGVSGCTIPLYLNKAWTLKDPVERVKYVMVMQVSTFRYTSSFLKPVRLDANVAQSYTGRNI